MYCKYDLGCGRSKFQWEDSSPPENLDGEWDLTEVEGGDELKSGSIAADLTLEARWQTLTSNLNTLEIDVSSANSYFHCGLLECAGRDSGEGHTE